MKLSTLLIATPILAFSAWADSVPAPTVITVPVTHIFAPKGFDANDNTEVVVTGVLPNLCYKGPRADVKVEGKEIKITVTAYKRGTLFCPQLAVPFMEIVNVGVLDKGSYTITANAGTEFSQTGAIAVAESKSPAIDDHVYANVRIVDRPDGSRKVLLKGSNPSTCFELDKIQWISNGADTYSILPILKQISDDCPRVLVPFSYEIEVPTELTEAELLLHVRVMNGKSVNALFHNHD